MLTTVDVPEALENPYAANKQLADSIATALAGQGEEKTLEANVEGVRF